MAGVGSGGGLESGGDRESGGGGGGHARHAQRQRDLAAFLRTHRERTDPREVGVPAAGRRRTPGLRREEVAMLAGMSVDYYTRLEQARDVQPSPSVVDAIARALQLGTAERDHLFRLSGCEPSRRPSTARVRPSVQRTLDALEPNPAFVTDRSMDVLAWNDAATRLLVDFATLPEADRNIAVLVFLDARGRELYPEWESVALDVVGLLRGSLGRYPDDPYPRTLVDRLAAGSPAFERLWSRQDVRERSSGSKTFAPPELGRLTLDYESLMIGETDQFLVVYSAPEGSGAQASLELLAALRAGR